MVAETNMYCSDGVRNSVSTSGYRLRFIPAIWNSYSKSDTARSPRRITRASCACTKSISSDEKRTTSTFGRSASTSCAISTRSAAVKNGRLVSLSATPTTTRSNSRAARRTRSSWPRVNGSKVPG